MCSCWPGGLSPPGKPARDAGQVVEMWSDSGAAAGLFHGFEYGSGPAHPIFGGHSGLLGEPSSHQPQARRPEDRFVLPLQKAGGDALQGDPAPPREPNLVGRGAEGAGGGSGGDRLPRRPLFILGHRGYRRSSPRVHHMHDDVTFDDSHDAGRAVLVLGGGQPGLSFWHGWKQAVLPKELQTHL